MCVCVCVCVCVWRGGVCGCVCGWVSVWVCVGARADVCVESTVNDIAYSA